MKNPEVPVSLENTNSEVLARILKAAAHKYECDVEIDFEDGKRKVIFTGDEKMKPHIAAEITDIFESKKETEN